MTITLDNVGKRFQREWIFRKLSLEIAAGSRIAIVGPNGSGKSTLLKVISGALPLTEGAVSYQNSGTNIGLDAIYKHISYAAPYVELIDAFTLRELLKFHFSFKKMRVEQSIEALATTFWLESALDKPIRFFSSGMRQRLKLGLSFLSLSPVLLLDEPTTNLDKKGVQWYEGMIATLAPETIVLVGSNQESEYNFCDQKINILHYKTGQ